MVFAAGVCIALWGTMPPAAVWLYCGVLLFVRASWLALLGCGVGWRSWFLPALPGWAALNALAEFW